MANRVTEGLGNLHLMITMGLGAWTISRGGYEVRRRKDSFEVEARPDSFKVHRRKDTFEVENK